MSETCPTCGETFKNELGMKSHHAQAHDESIAGVTIVCDYCGEKAEKNQRKKRNDHEFCSRECYNNYQSEELSGENSHAWKGGKVEVECDFCGSIVQKHAVNIEKSNNNFCDQQCHGKWISEHNTGDSNPMFKPELTVECAYCGEKTRTNSNKLKRNDKHFCDMECRGAYTSENRTGENHPRWVNDRVEVECAACGNDLIRRVAELKRKDRVYCDPECKGDYMANNLTGENGLHWKGGHERDYGPNWNQQRKKRLEKDGYECVICSMSNGEHHEEYDVDLHVHHIERKESFRDNNGELDFERANRLENLITLCYKCHGRWEGIPLKPQVQV